MTKYITIKLAVREDARSQQNTELAIREMCDRAKMAFFPTGAKTCKYPVYGTIVDWKVDTDFDNPCGEQILPSEDVPERIINITNVTPIIGGMDEDD